MKILILSLQLTNFKKARSLKVNFGKVTNIFGDNAVGKSTLFDAFLWLFFGKDSSDRKDFEIKTLDENGNPYHKLDHEVEAVIIANGSSINIRRSLREKWTKKKGSTEAEFTGHETAYFWNDVPCNQKDFDAKVGQLINEGLFKLLTNTAYFNNLKWQDRRATLEAIAGNISDEAVAAASFEYHTEFTALLAAIKGKKTLNEYKLEIAAGKKKLKSEIELLPSRIAEAKKALPDPADYEALELSKGEVEGQIGTIDSMLQSKSAAAQEHENNKLELMKQRQTLVVRKLEIENSTKNEVTAGATQRKTQLIEKRHDLTVLQSERNTLLNEHATIKAEINSITQKQADLRKQWAEENAKQFVFDEKLKCCPTCERDFPAEEIDTKKVEMEANFNKNKSTLLTSITTQGQELSKKLEPLQVNLTLKENAGKAKAEAITALSEEIATLEANDKTLLANESVQYENKLTNNSEYAELLVKANELTQQIEKPYEAEDNTALRLRRNELANQVKEIEKQINSKEFREKQLKRVEELESQESVMAQQLATLEGTEYIIQQFEKAKMNELETRVNSKFKLVTFKLFQKNINGGEEPCCITLVNGVPYADANTAGKIQAGLDIINTLSEHHGTQAPVWIDNRESVIALPETECQVINLIVSEPDKKLRVEVAAELEAAAV